jgi:hypothetical protein
VSGRLKKKQSIGGSWWVGADRPLFSRLLDRHVNREQRELSRAIRRYLRDHEVQRVPPQQRAARRAFSMSDADRALLARIARGGIE